MEAAAPKTSGPVSEVVISEVVISERSAEFIKDAELATAGCRSSNSRSGNPRLTRGSDTVARSGRRMERACSCL